MRQRVVGFGQITACLVGSCDVHEADDMANVGTELLDRARQCVESLAVPVELPIVVGLSGGVDSQVLLHTLLQVTQVSGHTLIAVHVDHGLRPESGSDARRVRELCDQWGVRCQVESVDVAVWNQRLRQGTESAARYARYAALARVAQDNDTNLVATGHTLDDQLETLLLRLLSGSGLEGLSGMTSVSERTVPLDPDAQETATVRIVRPLLTGTRKDVLAYADSVGIEPVEDASNTDLDYRRNAIRHTVIPQLESIESGVRSSVNRTLELLQDDVEFIADVVNDAYERVVAERDGLWMIDRRRFRLSHVAIQRRLLFRVLSPLIPSEARLGRERVDALRETVVDGQPGKVIEIAGDLVAYTDYDRVAVGRASTIEDELRRLSWVPLLEPGSEIELGGNIDIPLLNGWRVRGEASSKGQLILRTRRDGDRIRGTRGREIKLQDWLVDHKVPRYLRDWLPIVTLDNEVQWVIGLNMTEYPDWRNNIHLQLERDVPGS
jgi:tRNA(Ile)-lysidine synthetase-like protein